MKDRFIKLESVVGQYLSLFNNKKFDFNEREKYAKADEIIERLMRIEKMLEKQKDKPMGFNAAARYLGLSKSYLYKLTSRREIKFYCPKGKKIHFKKSDLDAYLLRNPIKSADEIEQEAIDYVALEEKNK